MCFLIPWMLLYHHACFKVAWQYFKVVIDVRFVRLISQVTLVILDQNFWCLCFRLHYKGDSNNSSWNCLYFELLYEGKSNCSHVEKLKMRSQLTALPVLEIYWDVFGQCRAWAIDTNFSSK